VDNTTTKQIWEMTPVQYREWRIAEVRKEYSCTRAEAEKCVYMPKYWTAVEQAAYDGHRIPNVVLDRTDEFGRYSILKRARAGGHDLQYADYIPLEIRKDPNYSPKFMYR
jgi:hypothetical protein